MNSINVYEQLIPGLGQRFEFEVDDGHTLCVVVLRDGRRQLARRSSGEDADTLVDLDRDQAVTIGALLHGAQFSITTPVDAEPADQVIADPIANTPAAPSIGKTPDIVELDPDLALSDGDRVAVATRRGQHHAIISVLTRAAPPTVTTQ